MERLTIKTTEIAGYFDSEMIVTKTSTQAIIDKLGALEDLEEQVGMSLVEYFNLIGKEIYVISCESYKYYLECYNKEYDKYFKDELYDYPKKEIVSFTSGNEVVYNHYEDHYYYPIDELGKTWFFTCEEALEKLEELQKDKEG